MRPPSGIGAVWADMRARPVREAGRTSAGGPPLDMPAWLRDESPAPARELPAWLRGTGGHQASAAEKRAAYAMFAAMRNAVAGKPSRPGVLAAMPAPDGMSPLARRIFGAGQ